MDNSITQIIKEKIQKNKSPIKIVLISFLFVITFYGFFYSYGNTKEIIVHISSNDNLTTIAKDFKNKKIINNIFVFKTFVHIFSGNRYIARGDYLFKKNASVIGVAWQISRGKHNIIPIKVTLKEGITNVQIANSLQKKIVGFRKDLFLNDSRVKEGYLFPDTYFFYPMSTVDEIITEITSNFKRKISSIDQEIKSSGKSLSDIIIMASILEKEASGKSDAAIISGILWKRIELGIPLQVDAAPITYDISGLPKEPICNPGLSFIIFALKPEKSQYLFYLHDDNGKVHYAVDFSEHRSNIARYLK